MITHRPHPGKYVLTFGVGSYLNTPKATVCIVLADVGLQIDTLNDAQTK